jgi:hypothetical protein
MLPSLFFIFPYRGQGGVPVVFSQLANYYAANNIAKVYVVDYRDGALAISVNDEVTLVEYFDDSPVLIPDHSFVVMQLMTPWSIFPSLSFGHSCRFVFWSLHPDNLRITIPFSLDLNPNIVIRRLIDILVCSYRRKIRFFLNLCFSTGSIIFMDRTTLRRTLFHAKTRLPSDNFLPVPFDNPNGRAKSISIQHSYSVTDLRPCDVSCAWVGRLVDFKIHGLLAFAHQLNAYAHSYSTILPLFIIGDGPSTIIDQLSTFKSVRSRWIKHLPLADLCDFLRHNVNLVIAMGSSALVSASMSIPTLLAPVSSSPLEKGFSFNWLHQMDGSTLGEYPDYYLYRTSPNLSVFDELVSSYESLSSKSYSYYRTHHSLPSIADRLLQILKSSTLSSVYLSQHRLLQRPASFRFYKAIISKLANLK